FNWERAFGLPEPWAGERESLGDAQLLHDALGSRRMSYPRLMLPPDILATAWSEGRTLSLESAVTETLAAAAGPAPGMDAAPGLTRRETEVLRLIAGGNSNRSIAVSLSLSERTVENHVTHILAKLDLESRTAAAAYAVRHGLV
ncbi:MAG TPA: response regulator transcription factor, partial [Chloroflexota bacterium]|nr:response regulator transcription factor [Chloroflexota bacterium]